MKSSGYWSLFSPFCYYTLPNYDSGNVNDTFDLHLTPTHISVSFILSVQMLPIDDLKTQGENENCLKFGHG